MSLNVREPKSFTTKPFVEILKMLVSKLKLTRGQADFEKTTISKFANDR